METTTKPTNHNALSAEFTITGEILTKLRPRAAVIGGHARVYTPKQTINYETHIKQSYLANNKHIYFRDYPLRIEIIAFFKVPKAYEKYDDVYDLPCVKHKDLDNIAKTVCDALNKVAYDDDKNIRTLIVQKYWTKDQEKIEVSIFTDGQTEEEFKNDQKAKAILKEYVAEKNSAKPNQKKLDRLWEKLQPYLPKGDPEAKIEGNVTDN